MSDTTRAPIDGPPSASPHTFLATFGVILGLIAAFLALDFVLARLERNETRQHAADVYAEGRALLAAGRASDAADRLSTAMSLQRENVPYALAHAQAMLAEGRVSDAEQSLNELLVRAQNDGQVNLTMARLLSTSGRRNDAKAFYHRAIYGQWGADSTSERLAARFELIDVLVLENARTELLAELLPLQSAPSESTTFLVRVAPLYLRAGSPARAADAYRQLIDRTPGDADAYAGLGKAALALGEFPTARTAFASAVRQRPSDSALASRLRLVDTLLALDPNAHSVSDAVRLERTRGLLARTVESLDACSAAEFPVAAQAAQDSARAELLSERRGNAVASNDRALALARTLWRERPASCAANGGRRDEVLTRLLGNVAR
jgi:tetratricopeptide (TPR) repeat protein